MRAANSGAGTRTSWLPLIAGVTCSTGGMNRIHAIAALVLVVSIPTLARGDVVLYASQAEFDAATRSSVAVTFRGICPSRVARAGVAISRNGGG